MIALRLDLIQTLAVGALVFLVGIALKRVLPVLARLNIPSAVVGGLVFAALVLVARDRFLNLQIDTAAQPLFMVAFFTTIGMSASLSLLRRGGVQVVVFLAIATVFCFVQNFVGMGIAAVYDVPPLLGVVAGSVTLVGGPATGLAFAPLFESAGVTGAATLALAAATFGIVCGGLTGGPVGTRLIERHGLGAKRRSSASRAKPAPAEGDEDTVTLNVDVEREDSSLVMNLIALAVAMGLGSVLSFYFKEIGLTLPAYVGAMLVASLARNLDDFKGWFGIDQRTMELIGGVSLNIFLVVALMDLKLWQLVNLALPLVTILAAQVVIVVAFALTICYWVMGRDYDSAVMASGFVGFVLGTTANAMANMKTLVVEYGAAPRAFLIVPLVGAFFVDFTNALVITFFLNWLQ